MQTLLAAAITATQDPDVAAEAKPFVHGVCTHLALLYTCGHAMSQPELGVSGLWGAVAGGAVARPAFAELDMRVALQVLLESSVQDLCGLCKRCLCRLCEGWGNLLGGFAEQSVELMC